MAKRRVGAREPKLDRTWGARLRELGKARLLRFLLVGGIGYLVNQLVLYLIYDGPFTLGLPAKGDDWTTPLFYIRDLRLLVASVAAVEAAILSNFLWHNFWTFSGASGQRIYYRFLKFNITSLGSPAISLLMTNTLTPYLGVHYLIANSIGILLGTTWNWLWASKVIWRRPPAPKRKRKGYRSV